MRVLIVMSSLLFLGCYSFQGISIPPEVDTFFVENIEDRTGEMPPGFNENFSENLAEKIRSNTRLLIDNGNPDIYFTCVVTLFTVRAEDPNRNTGTALNRLYLNMEVTYFNIKTDEERKLKYNETEDFGAEQDFIDVQEDLLAEVSERIIERIFNDSFTNW